MNQQTRKKEPEDKIWNRLVKDDCPFEERLCV